MQSPWKTDHRGHAGGEDILGNTASNDRTGQLLLGEIERSTSAPPIPTAMPGSLDDVGRLGEQGARRESFLFELGGNRHAEAASLFPPDGRESAPSVNNVSSSALFFGAEPDLYYGGTDTTVEPDFMDSRVASDTRAILLRRPGSVGAPPSSSRSSDVGGINDFISKNSRSVVRSVSAAPGLLGDNPTTLGPPPGLDRPPNDSFYRHDLGLKQRSTSPGVLGDFDQMSSSLSSHIGVEFGGAGGDSVGVGAVGAVGAVRPAPKTLRDLFPDIPHGMDLRRSHTAAPTSVDRESVYYGQDHRSRSVSPPRSRLFEVHGAHLHPSELPGTTDERDIDRMERMRSGHSGQSQKILGTVSQTIVPPALSHQIDPEPRDMKARYPQHVVVQQQPTIVQPSPRPVAVEHSNQHYRHQQPQPIYAPAHNHQVPPMHVQHIYDGPHVSPPQRPPPTSQFEGQHIFYNPVQPSSQRRAGMERPQPANVQIFPSGHTVYLNPSPYAYTVQYHTHPQPHPTHNSGPSHEYVSVIPVQTPNAPISYWPAPEGGPQGTLQPAPTLVLSPPGVRSVPIAVADAHTVEVAPSRHNIRSKRNGGGNSTKSPDERGKGKRGGNAGGRRDPHGKMTAGGSISSPLLEDFRATKSRDWTILDIKGHVVMFCQDQNGSRFIQQRLELGNSHEKEIVMTEVLPAVRQLRNDVFGNYVVQKLLEYGTPQMKANLKETLEGEMLQLSLQMYGCRVVQTALEALDDDDLPRLLTEFHKNVLNCIHDQNGNHVVQKCIEVMSLKSKQASSVGDVAKADFFSAEIDFIVDDVLDNVVDLSCHPYGCRVLQRILEHCVEPKKNRALDCISQCHKVLLDDQYGNYVIQHVLQYGRNSDRDSVLRIVVENGLLSLSRQKFASNVVEKLLKFGTPDQRNSVVGEMLKKVEDLSGSIESHTSVVLLMVRDAYANYVVQTALDVAPEGLERQMLLDELNSHADQLQKYTYAKHIVTKLSA